MGGQAKSKKITYFKNFSKITQYFFLALSLPLRRIVKTFSEKNSKKNKIFILSKKFRTIFFSPIFSIFVSSYNLHLRGPRRASAACIDGWVMGGQAKSKKITYFKNFSKTTRYFFLVVSLPLRRVFKTFSVKNSEKINFFFQKFRTIFFSAIFSIFWVIWLIFRAL